MSFSLGYEMVYNIQVQARSSSTVLTLNLQLTTTVSNPPPQECSWKRTAKPNEKSCLLDDLNIAKAEYEKTTKIAIKVNINPY